jgi:hypothetical protein
LHRSASEDVPPSLHTAAQIVRGHAKIKIPETWPWGSPPPLSRSLNDQGSLTPPGKGSLLVRRVQRIRPATEKSEKNLRRVVVDGRFLSVVLARMSA